jgi:hypothetical protein
LGQTKRVFVGRSSAAVKKICKVWQKMGLFGPHSVPPNQLQQMMATRKKSRPIFTGQLYLPSINRPYSLFIFMRYIAMFTE